jgi:hypothetical protein
VHVASGTIKKGKSKVTIFAKSGKKGKQVSGCHRANQMVRHKREPAPAQRPSFIPRSIWCPGKRTGAFNLLSFSPFSFAKFFFS